MLDPLFSGISIGTAIDDQRRKVEADIAALQRDELLERGLDDLETERVELYRMDPLVLRWDERTPESRDVDLEIDSDVDREISDRTQPVKVKGTEITLFVPFTGAAGLFHMRPSTHADDPPRGFVSEEDNLLLRYSYADAERANVKRELDRQVAAVKERVSSINNDVGPFNADLPGEVRARLEARLDKLRADEDDVATLGVPLRQRPTSKRGDIEPNPAEPGHVDAQPTPPPDQAIRLQTRSPGRPPGTRYLARAGVLRAKQELDADAALGKLKTRNARIRRYVTMQDLAEKLEAPLGTLQDFLRAEHLRWLDRASWPPE